MLWGNKKFKNFSSKNHLPAVDQSKFFDWDNVDRDIDAEEVEDNTDKTHKLIKVLNKIYAKAINKLPKKYQDELKNDEGMREELFDTWFYSSDDSDMFERKMSKWLKGELTDDQLIQQCLKRSNLKAAYESIVRNEDHI